MARKKEEGRLIWRTGIVAGEITVPQDGTFNVGRNAAKRAARAAAKAQTKRKKREH